MLPFNLPELEVSGLALVTAIDDCPQIAGGEGSVVTARFVTREVHFVASVDVLGADGTVETITGTTIYPVWSVDRQSWVPLAELTQGERLCCDTESFGLCFPSSLSPKASGLVLSVSLSRVSQPVYNIEIHGEHVYQVGELGLVVHNSYPNLKTNSAVGRFGLYEIEVNGVLHKVGKAHLDRITLSSGLPTRLHQQVRKLREIFGRDNVVGRVVEDLGEVSTEVAKQAENTRILNKLQETGFVPLGNWKSFFL
jgi:hypothetical protein